jgi:putative toxin-antitoxin system antitoxin component (TIGR02293 family)
MARVNRLKVRASRSMAGRGPAIRGLAVAVREGKAAPYGFAALVGLASRDLLELQKQVEKGLSYRALVRFQRILSISLQELAELVRITPRTLTRRRGQGRLQPEESDRLLRASRIFAQALQLFEGDAESARGWLKAPQVALGGLRPFDMIKTDIGAREVESLIGRLEHGISA